MLNCISLTRQQSYELDLMENALENVTMKNYVSIKDATLGGEPKKMYIVDYQNQPFVHVL